jgi:hypothetical protein
MFRGTPDDAEAPQTFCPTTNTGPEFQNLRMRLTVDAYRNVSLVYESGLPKDAPHAMRGLCRVIERDIAVSAWNVRMRRLDPRTWKPQTWWRCKFPIYAILPVAFVFAIASYVAYGWVMLSRSEVDY